MAKRAFIFDLNGTMIDDMNFHIRAWHDILNQLGAELTLEQVKLECYGKNEELLERIFPGRFSEDEMQLMIARKEAGYREVFRPYLQLIDGLDVFLRQAHSNNILMGIGSAALPENINYVLDGLSIRNYFKAIVSATDVRISKPDPETFLLCADKLGVQPEDCIVFEDAPKGVEAASLAGMSCVVLTTMHPEDDFNGWEHTLFKVPNYSDDRLISLVQ
ncbi:MAG: beta-phosphoglucomutase family hydrolase [Chitinophagaceae bacterium]|jgi:beta-phosphoglucomutase|nr:beta-phosphoglucomutase family hydrolase [Chitinophagaceae bacterium]MCA6469607.1 beta-phosphoglucomutase family hydrolase [Chitinophagaceae bacterium]MCA6476388.1 beta-phosphoglucomutase family hydrolase [Chitinophagaceae bacterium]MCA6480903.1 beta-phosphoglucomutase family hydrolase [Chitinophagaceae bacterium]MCA6491359.1 beta-phosphoglucomutase family hydrolase [Chitinophagaceae bacterium]